MKKHYSFADMKFYDFDYNIICGGRSNGKTTEIEKEVLFKNWIERKEKFVKIVRYNEQVGGKGCKKWFTRNANEYIESFGYKIKFYSGEYYINSVDADDKKFISTGESIGMVIPLSLESNYKSNDFEDVTSVVFDEFQEQDKFRYVHKEIEHFLSLLSTINRMRDNVKVFLIGNAMDYYNPYFEFFGIDPLNLKAGNIYSFSATNEFDNPATVGLEFVPMLAENEEDVPRLLRVSNNLQATKISQYELPNSVIKKDDWIIRALESELFDEFYKVLFEIEISVDETDIFKYDEKNEKWLYDRINCYYIVEKSNKNNVYIVEKNKKRNIYGLSLYFDNKFTVFKFDDDIRNKNKSLDLKYLSKKNIKFGGVNLCTIFNM